MTGRSVRITAIVLAVAGLALLGYETVQAMRDVAIGTLGDTLLYVGLGLFVLAAVLIVVDLTTSPEPSVDVVPMEIVDDKAAPST